MKLPRPDLICALICSSDRLACQAASRKSRGVGPVLLAMPPLPSVPWQRAHSWW
jgi:hypothetical protein